MMTSKFRRSDNPRYKRSQGSRQPRERYLIVCEGQTEKKYFEEFKQENRITSTSILSANGRTEPTQLIKKADDHCKRNIGIDRVYLVFDRDTHKSYNDALISIKNTPKYVAIPSVPCFELWILLHYQYQQSRLDSNTAQLLLKKHLAEYKKNMPYLFKHTKAHLEQAKINATKLRDIEKYTAESGKDPYTDIDQLIEDLEKLNIL